MLAWIAALALNLVVIGLGIFRYLKGMSLIGETPTGRAIIAQDDQLLLALWPLVLAGVLLAAVPAWLVITRIFFKLYTEAQQELQTRVDASIAQATADLRAAEFRHEAQRQALAIREAQALQMQRQAEQAQQEAAKQINIAKTQVQNAELRARRATSAFQRTKQKIAAIRPAARGGQEERELSKPATDQRKAD